jgi:hypothetical protein
MSSLEFFFSMNIRKYFKPSEERRVCRSVVEAGSDSGNLASPPSPSYIILFLKNNSHALVWD